MLYAVHFRYQKLKWVAVPNPDQWSVSINAGLTPDLN